MNGRLYAVAGEGTKRPATLDLQRAEQVRAAARKTVAEWGNRPSTVIKVAATAKEIFSAVVAHKAGGVA
jgi:hypothetical protein